MLTNTIAPPRHARILVVDDHPTVRLGLAKLLEGEPDLELAAEAESAQEALLLLSCEPLDLAIIDVQLPGTSGIELVKTMRRGWPWVSILVSSLHEESLFAERALDAGASGYIEKRRTILELLGAVRRVLEGGRYLSPEMEHRLRSRRPRQASAEEPGSGSQRLTDRELEVFALLGDGLTTRQIASRLVISHKTVETHLGHIKLKLGTTSINQLIRCAVECRLFPGSIPRDGCARNGGGRIDCAHARAIDRSERGNETT